MYEEFFELTHRPFTSIPNPDMFVGLDHTQEALDELLTCVTQARGIGVVTSPAGLGKTILCKRLVEIAQSQFQTVFLSTSTFGTRLDLLQNILYEFGIEYDGLNDHQARLKIMRAAEAISEQGKSLLIVVDEAHLLNIRFFDELRILADYAPDGEALIQVVLAGQFELEEKLADPSLSALSQRIGCHISLKLLTLDESVQFLSKRLAMCGAEDLSEILDEEALEAICRASDGNPRCLCQLADQSLLLAFAEEQRPIHLETVLSAFEDVKELPLHWNDIRNSDDGELEIDLDEGLAQTIEFTLPSQELEEAKTDLEETGLFGPEESLIIPNREVDKESCDQDETTEFAEFSSTDDSEVEFNVIEVGAGLTDVNESRDEDSTEHSNVCEESDVSESSPTEECEVVTVDPAEETVVDKYAQLDAFAEKHGTDLDHFLDSIEYPQPVGFTDSPVTEGESGLESSVEHSILDDVAEIGKEISSAVAAAKQSRMARGNPYGETWVETDIVQPIVEEAKQAFQTTTSPEVNQHAATNRSNQSSRQAVTTEHAPRGFANLFTRLRQRRKILSEKQSS